MSLAETLSKMFQDIQVTGQFEKKEIKAVLTILRQMVERLEAVERVCKIQHPG